MPIILNVPSIWMYCFLPSKYFPEHKLPDNVVATTDAKMALLGADFCLHAVPVQVIWKPLLRAYVLLILLTFNKMNIPSIKND